LGDETEHQQELVLSLPDLISKFAGRYVAIEVLRRDGDGQPTHGRVIQSHFDKYKLKDLVQGEKEICIFYAGPVPKEGYATAI
jgi:hypothetical protein